MHLPTAIPQKAKMIAIHGSGEFLVLLLYTL